MKFLGNSNICIHVQLNVNVHQLGTMLQFASFLITLSETGSSETACFAYNMKHKKIIYLISTATKGYHTCNYMHVNE